MNTKKIKTIIRKEWGSFQEPTGVVHGGIHAADHDSIAVDHHLYHG